MSVYIISVHVRYQHAAAWRARLGRTRAATVVVAAPLSHSRARDHRRALAAPRRPVARAGRWWRPRGRSGARGTRGVQRGEPAGEIPGATAASAYATSDHAG